MSSAATLDAKTLMRSAPDHMTGSEDVAAEAFYSSMVTGIDIGWYLGAIGFAS